METIAQLQSKLQEAADLLASVTRELDAHRNAGAAAESFDFARLRCDAENHPYTGHPVARSSMPELYYLLLLTVLTTAEAKEAQWLHLYRIAKGADYAQDVHDLLPAAHAMTDARMVECIECIRRDNLTRAFLLDAMILTLLREEEDTSLLEYIAGLAALMEVPPAEITEVIQLAKCVTSQDSERYIEFLGKSSIEHAKETAFYFPQMTDDLNSAVHHNTKHLIIANVSKRNTQINLDEWKAKRISFMMCDFENMTFKSNQKHVDFLGCTFKKVYHMCCISINNSMIKDCVFDDCKADAKSPVIRLSNVEISNTEFTHCITEDADAKCLFEVDQTTMTGCRFTYCIRKGGASSDAGIVQATNNSVLQNCIFECCSTDDRDPLSISMSSIIWTTSRKKAPTSSILLLHNSIVKNVTFQSCTGEKTQQMS